jgi:hypothetical protein
MLTNGIEPFSFCQGFQDFFCFMDFMTLIVVTIPIFFLVMMKPEFNPIW